MRTFFEIEQQDEYHVAQRLLVRRCEAWADEQELPADPLILAAALDSRHMSTDGRLALWRPADVRRLLLEWIPKRIAADLSELTEAPQSLRTLLRFLVASGLWDPRGASLEENEAAITEVAVEFPAVLADPERWGVGKFWALAARDNGVDVTDPRAMARFTDDIREGRAAYDGELLDRLMERQFLRSEPEPDRAFSQLPVSLPPAEELAREAARSRVVQQLIAFTEWVGADGRVLTAAGNLKPADARELVDLLGTGEKHLKIRTSTDLPRLNMIFIWAKKARLVRIVNKTRLVQVAKAKPLLRDAEALWQRAFDTFFELRDAICLPLWTAGGTSMLHDVFVDAVPDVLNAIYSMPHPMPMLRLEESVWTSCQAQFSIDAGTPAQQEHWRGHLGVDLARVFDVLAALGAVEKTHGVAHEMFTFDLDDDFEMPIPAERPFSGPDAARLREQLAQPGDLVALTALGTRAIRGRMLAEGRDVGLVGDLAAAQPAELLGVVAQHYPPETAREEIAGWLAGHDDDVELLLDAVRECRFRARASAMLNVVCTAVADRTEFLRRLRDDPVLAPLAVMALHEDGVLPADDMTEREHALVMTESFLQLFEIGGPDAVREALKNMSKSDRAGLLAVMKNCGHPGGQTLREFQAIIADLPSAPPARPAGSSRPSRPGRSGRRPGRTRRR